jgi:hypothetical protein
MPTTTNQPTILDTYKILWEKLWRQQDNVYQRPAPGVPNTALTYEIYDFSSLPCEVLPGDDTAFAIRQEYCTLYDTLLKWYNEVGQDPTRGAVVTGHPGIGMLYSKREPESLVEHYIFFRKINFLVVYLGSKTASAQTHRSRGRRRMVPFQRRWCE